MWNTNSNCIYSCRIGLSLARTYKNGDFGAVLPNGATRR